MTTLSAKDIVVTWDGDPSSWADYSRKVRLQWEKTEKHKRKLLGPELASRLSGRAWAVVPSLDHKLLQKKNGTKYLLRFLRDRLCRTAVPDAGAKLEELFIKMKRPAGMTMSEWANQVQESYRKVQRALVRARQVSKRAPQGEPVGSTATRSEPQAEPPSPQRPRSSPRPSPHPSPPTSPTRQRDRGAQDAGPDDVPDPEQGGYAAVPQDDPSEHAQQEWTDEEWRQWYKSRRGDYDDDSSSFGEDYAWDELEVEEVHVLPDEILGWLLLRRANLSSANRLAVQSSVQNSLFFRDIENALRDQEEELLQADQHRLPHRKRTYWVEDQGVWGLLVSEDAVDEMSDIHWVGSNLPADVYMPEYAEDDQDEDEEVHWVYDYDGWHGHVQDAYGVWYETDGCGTYWTGDDYNDLTAEQIKELDEAYAVYYNKVRTFQQSRQFQRSKGKSRGFYPVKMMKGKGKGKGKKGKGKASSSGPSSPSSKPMFMTQTNAEVMTSAETKDMDLECAQRERIAEAKHRLLLPQDLCGQVLTGWSLSPRALWTRCSWPLQQMSTLSSMTTSLPRPSPWTMTTTSTTRRSWTPSTLLTPSTWWQLWRCLRMRSPSTAST